MENMTVFLFSAAIALFTFFGVAPMILNAASLFGVQKRFAEAMIQEGVVKAEDVRRLYPGKQVAGVIVTLVLVAAVGVAAYKTAPAGYFAVGIPLAAGLLRYRRIMQYNSLTVQRFKNTFQAVMDVKKFNRFVDTHF